MKHAWIENDRVRDVAPGDPFQFYHPDIAAYYSTLIPDDVQMGANWDGEKWVNQIILPYQDITREEVLTPLRRVGQQELREAMSLAERVKWDNDMSPTIKTAKIELGFSKLVSEVRPILQMLVDAGDIGQATVDALDLDTEQTPATV